MPKGIKVTLVEALRKLGHVELAKGIESGDIDEEDKKVRNGVLKKKMRNRPQVKSIENGEYILRIRGRDYSIVKALLK